jgi:hypothetical protein
VCQEFEVTTCTSAWLQYLNPWQLSLLYLRTGGGEHGRPALRQCLATERRYASAVHLPQGHCVREVLAAASVRGYFKDDKHKFAMEAKEIPGFSSDLLEAVKDALQTLSKGNHEVSITDPINGNLFLKS